MKNGKRFKKQRKEIPVIYRIELKKQWMIILSACGIGTFAAWLCYCSFKAWPAAILVAVLYALLRVQETVRENRMSMRLHFRDFLNSVHVAVRSGYSLENAVRSGFRDISALYGQADYLVQELETLIRQMEYQVSVEQLFRNLGRRTEIEEIVSFAEMIMVTKRTGGNLGKALGDAWKILSRRMDTEYEIETLIAAKRYEQTIMSLMPAGIILYLRFTFPGFVEQLYGNFTGVMVMTGALIMYIAAFALGRRMVRIEV